MEKCWDASYKKQISNQGDRNIRRVLRQCFSTCKDIEITFREVWSSRVSSKSTKGAVNIEAKMLCRYTDQRPSIHWKLSYSSDEAEKRDGGDREIFISAVVGLLLGQHLHSSGEDRYVHSWEKQSARTISQVMRFATIDEAIDNSSSEFCLGCWDFHGSRGQARGRLKKIAVHHSLGCAALMEQLNRVWQINKFRSTNKVPSRHLSDAPGTKVSIDRPWVTTHSTSVRIWKRW